ncbi:MAG: protein kinase, partial [Verrucomicrobiales bacterium]|nr:protein kinase [Verrucomicrobiales bacterium]
MEESSAEELKTEIFHRALEILDPVARTQLVKQLCSDDLALRRGVEELLELDGDRTLCLDSSDQVGRIRPGEPVVDKSPPEAGNYAVGEEIARGGMGSIREAEDTKLDRKVAVKVMHWDVQADPASQARFLLEAKVLAHLAHPNIVPIHDIVWENGKPLFYSMKLVAGQSLQKILNDLHSGDSVAIDAYPLERLLSIFRKICDAIAFAHSRGIIHRDLKPENVMVGEFGEVLVMDWGLAKILSQTEDPVQPDTVEIDYSNQSIGATLEGSVMGTPQYMSPEQAAGEIGRMDYRSDIFSLGGILYAILTLRPPVDGENINEVLEKVRSGDVNPPTVYSSVKGSRAKTRDPSSQNNCESIILPHIRHGHVPEALSAVAMKALSVKKRDRYQQATDLSSDIEKWQNGYATSAEDAGLRTHLALLINRHKTLFTTATVAWAVITALAVWFIVNLQAKEKRAVAGEAAATQALARSSLSLAEAALRETDGATMRASLDQVPQQMRDAVWEYLDGQSHSSIRTIDGPRITGVAANPAVPGVFAYSDVKNVVRLVSAVTGEISLEFHTDFKPHTIAFSPDGTKLALGTVEGAVNPVIYDGEDGQILLKLPVDKTAYIKFNNDGSLLLHVKRVAGNVAEVSLWKVATGQKLWSKNFSDTFLHQADFIPGGNLIFLGSGGQSFCISQDNGSIVTREVTMRLQAFAVSKNGRFVICGTPDGVAKYLLPELRRVYEIKKGNARINKVLLSSDNSRFLVFWNRTDSSRDPGFEIRDSITGELRRSFPETEGASAVMDMHPLSGEIFMGGSKRTVWEGESPLFLKIPTSFKRNGMFFGTDEWFLGPVGNREFALYQIKNGETKVISRFASKNTSRWTVTGSPSGDSAFLTALGGGQKPFRFLKNPGLDAEVLAPKPRPDFPSSINSLDPRSGRLLASSGYRTEIRDAKTSETIIELQHRSDSVQGKYSVSDLAWIDSGNKVLGAGSKTVNGAEEYCLLVWDALTGEIVKSVALDNRLEILSVPTVGNRFAATGREKKIQIFDVESLGRTTEFRAHDAEIGALAWHPTLPVLASASADFTVKIWDLETQKCIQILRSLDSGPTGLSFSPGGRYLTCSDAQNIRVWELESVQNPVLNCDLTGNFVARLKDRQKLAHAVDGEPVSGEPVGDVRKDLFKTSMLLAEAALREHDGGLLNKALQAVPIFMRDRTWDYLKKQTNTSIRTISGGPVPAVAANPQIPNVFAYSDSRNVIRMINVRTGTELLKFSGDFAVTVMVFSKDGKILALGNRNGETIAIHRASDGRRLIQWNSGQSIDIEFTHNGKSLLQLSRRAGVPPVVNLWNTETGELVWNTEVGGHFCKTINLIPGEERFLFGRNGELLVLSEADGSVVQKIKQPGVLSGSAVSKDGLFAITGTTGGHLTKKFLKGPQSGFVIRKPDASIREIHLSSDDGRFFVSWQSKSRTGG